MLARARVLGTIMRRAAEGQRSAPPRRFFVRNALPPAIFYVERFSLQLLNVCTRQSLGYHNAQSGQRRAISAASAIFRAECAASGNFSCGMTSLCDFCQRYMTFDSYCERVYMFFGCISPLVSRCCIMQHL